MYSYYIVFFCSYTTKKRFEKDFNEVWGKYMKPFSLFNLIKKDDRNDVILFNKGVFGCMHWKICFRWIA